MQGETIVNEQNNSASTEEKKSEPAMITIELERVLSYASRAGRWDGLRIAVIDCSKLFLIVGVLSSIMIFGGSKPTQPVAPSVPAVPAMVEKAPEPAQPPVVKAEPPKEEKTDVHDKKEVKVKKDHKEKSGK